MNSQNNYQHLSFNPKRHIRTDKHPRYTPQFKQNLNLPLSSNPLNNPRSYPFDDSSRLRQKYA